MTALIYLIVAAVAVQRMVEVVYATRNMRALLERGAVEIGAAHYPLIVFLHVAWLAAIVMFLPVPRQIFWLPFAIFLVLQAMRIWVLTTLGPYWTTRIVTLADAPLITHGPYRYLRHPNYWIVVGEILFLPLSFGEWRVALLFTVLNGAMLSWRIKQENAALAPRRRL